MKIVFKGGIVDKFNVVNAENGKKIYDVAKRSVMGTRYSVMSKRVKVATVMISAYNIKKADMFIGDMNIGYIETDWTNKLDVKIKNKWYISKNRDGYEVRSYGKIICKVDCKYGLSDKYVVDIVEEDNILEAVCVILALDIINYEVERWELLEQE